MNYPVDVPEKAEFRNYQEGQTSGCFGENQERCKIPQPEDPGGYFFVTRSGTAGTSAATHSAYEIRFTPREGFTAEETLWKLYQGRRLSEAGEIRFWPNFPRQLT